MPRQRSSSSRLTWSATQRVYATDVTEHFVGAQALGLECPLDVFEQLWTARISPNPAATECGSVDQRKA
jgi:hypothetical protein